LLAGPTRAHAGKGLGGRVSEGWPGDGRDERSSVRGAVCRIFGRPAAAAAGNPAQPCCIGGWGHPVPPIEHGAGSPGRPSKRLRSARAASEVVLPSRFGWTRATSEAEAGSRRAGLEGRAAGTVMESSRPACRGANLGGCGRWRRTTSRVAPRGVPFVSFCEERHAGFAALRAARRQSRVPAEPRRRRKSASGSAPYPPRSRGRSSPLGGWHRRSAAREADRVGDERDAQQRDAGVVPARAQVGRSGQQGERQERERVKVLLVDEAHR
jgi:hypothetical protein